MLFTWPGQGQKGTPFSPPLVSAEVQAMIGGAAVTLTQPVQFRQVDPVRGEVRRNMEVVPAICIAFETPLDIVPTSQRGKPRRMAVSVQSSAQKPISGTVSLEAPAGWTVIPASIAFTLSSRGERSMLEFSFTPAGSTPAGQYELKVHASVGSRTFALSQRTLSYPHIQTHRLYQPAAAQVRVLDLAVAPVKVGYVMGSGDQVPDALRLMGLPVTMLDDATLFTGDLTLFDTIVVGIRASEARPGFPAFNGRLLDYVRAGGTLIVQYQQPDYAARQLAPFPAQGASRVTDETAAVTMLNPGNAVFSTPNLAGPADFDGWVQERNLYAFASFDARYTPLLESHDPGEQPQTGGELYARIGKGNYIYTSYAWFRQLPAGVPGAYRLFANLVSLGAK
jgi:hypothetical protein